ncbi:hypothetical protein FRC12_000088 [Ceratobasidium sp. 428]|nr:hypothetical protein FRC12_000088 [Ceratobasidium sp. 428]
MRGSGAGISRDVLLYGLVGVTPASVEFACNNVHDKLPPITSSVPPRQATFFGIQNVFVADGSGRFATTCAPPRAGVSVLAPSHPVYPPAGITPLIAGHQGLPPPSSPEGLKTQRAPTRLDAQGCVGRANEATS